MSSSFCFRPIPVDPCLPAIYQDLESILLDEAAIQKRVRELGETIGRDYAGGNLFMMSVLKGSVVFLADITRAVSIPMEYGFITISTYLGGTRSRREPAVTNQTFPDLKGRDVLLVEDILDSGTTIAFAKSWVEKAGAASVRTCVLVAKEGFEKSAFPNPDYVGFRIPNVFIVGYGLDYQEKYRNLSCIGVLKPSVYLPEDGPSGAAATDGEKG